MHSVFFRGKKCDLSCLFCATGSVESKNDSGGSARPDFPDILNDLPDLTARKGGPLPESECILLGAEPLESPDFFKVAAEIRRRGYAHIRLSTNGVRLADAGLVAKLAESGVDKIDLPIYGSRPAIHDSITRTPGSFALLMKAIENIRRCPGIRVNPLHTVILKQNLADLPEMCAFARENADLAPFELRLPHAHAAEEFRSMPANCPSLSEIRSVLEKIPPGRYRLSGLPPCVCPHHLKWPEGDAEAKRSASRGKAKAPAASWPAATWLLPSGGAPLNPGYRYAAKCGGCAMKSACPGVPESYLSLYGDGELDPARLPHDFTRAR